MGWLARALAVAAAVFTAVACDPSGKVYEDVRLSQLKEGESTEQDVRKLFGSPHSVREMAGGKGLVYPLGPEGPYTLLIRIGADGKYIGRENLLTRANFGRLNTGMKQAEVLAVLGPPGRSQEYRLKNETAWEWRFNDGAETRMFVVMFDADGMVVSTAIEEDPRRMGGS
jgi:outer membrane protein assembly factor BamE (lipoprotein component of BamABCDE complex)